MAAPSSSARAPDPLQQPAMDTGPQIPRHSPHLLLFICPLTMDPQAMSKTAKAARSRSRLQLVPGKEATAYTYVARGRPGPAASCLCLGV